MLRPFRFALPFLLASTLLAQTAVWAEEATSPVEWKIGIVQGLTPENCRATLFETFKANGQDPENDRAIQTAIESACQTGAREFVIVTPQTEKDPVFTLDATGSGTMGNVNVGNITGTASVEKTWEKHELEVVATGTWFMEENGTSYHSFAVSGLEEYFLTNHWSIFAYVGIGQDTKKALAFTSNEFAGAIYNIFGRESEHQLKISGAVGHRYEETLDGALAAEANDQGFSNNNAVMSWRVKYEDKLFDDAIELMAALWFQHILYSPPNGVDGHRFFDVSDYRLVAQLSLKVNVARFQSGAKAYISFGGTYEYFARPLTSSPYDLTLQGGLGVSF
jgi:hypothetical protein